MLAVPAVLILTGDYPFELEIFYYLCLKGLKVKAGPQVPLAAALMKLWDVWRLFKAGTSSSPIFVQQLLSFFGSSPAVLTQPYHRELFKPGGCFLHPLPSASFEPVLGVPGHGRGSELVPRS